MAATAIIEFDGGHDFKLRILDRLLTESIPITSRSESLINSLEIVKITTPVILTKLLQTMSCCPICTDDFVVDDNLTQQPYCRHWFHHKCILPWLKRKNTCPLCRHELFDGVMDIDDITTQNQQIFSSFEEVEVEHMLMEMLQEELNERDIRQSMETDFSFSISQYEQLFVGRSSVSEEQLQHQYRQTIDDILSELLDES